MDMGTSKSFILCQAWFCHLEQMADSICCDHLLIGLFLVSMGLKCHLEAKGLSVKVFLAGAQPVAQSPTEMTEFEEDDKVIRRGATYQIWGVICFRLRVFRVSQGVDDVLGIDLKRCGVRVEDERCLSFLSNPKKVFSVISAQ